MQPEEHLLALEKKLLDPCFRENLEEVSELLAEEFREFGSSGRIYDKRQILDLLQQESSAQVTFTQGQVALIAPGAALVTYVSERTEADEAKRALRSSVWVFNAGSWRMMFHQGTRC